MSKLKFELGRWFAIICWVIATSISLYHILNQTAHWLWISIPIGLFVFMADSGVFNFKRNN